MNDTLRNFKIAKQYIKESPSLPNIIKALLYLLNGPSSYLTGAPDILPGFLLKGLMKGSQLEKQLSKAGTISTNAVKALANKSNKLEGNLLNKVLDNIFPALRAVNYDLFRKAVLLELIPYLTSSSTKYADYGLDRLGFSTRMNPNNVVFNPATGLFESKAVKLSTFTFLSPRIPLGNGLHYNKNTLGHTRTFESPDEPGILNVLETLSDWALHPINSGYEKASKAANHHLQLLRKMLSLLREIGLPTLETEARVPILTLYKEVPSYHIKYLLENYLPRLLLENMLYASRHGYSHMRYPTRETAVKVEGYEPKLLFNGNIAKETEALNILNRILQIELQMHLANPFALRNLYRELNNLKLLYNILKLESTAQVYSPQEETILKKYDSFPKMFERLFRDLKPLIVKDIKGNSWFEFAIPKNMLLMELLYKKGGII